MAEPIKFTELTNAGTLDLSAIMAIVQQQGGELVSLQCSMAQVAELVASSAVYADLTTEQKKLIDAINELNAGKQKKLIAGANITINEETGEISSAGGGGGGDVTKAYVDEQNALQDAEITKNKDSLTELNDNFNEVVTISKSEGNIFDPSTVTHQVYDYNGNISDNSNYSLTDFIEVSTKRLWYLASNYNGAFIQFDENKNFIRRTDNILYSNGRRIYNDTTFIRIQIGKQLWEMPDEVTILSETPITETPIYIPNEKKINDDVIVKDSRLYVGRKLGNMGTQDGDQTIAIGDGSCRDENCGGIAIGVNALGSVSGSVLTNDNNHYSVAIGHRALANNNGGDHNTAIGWGAMADNATGNANTAVGEDALCHATNKDGNTAIGNRAMQSANGERNTSIGANSMFENSSNVPTGTGNTAIGYNSGITKSGGGNYNCAMGYGARNTPNQNFSIAIGSLAETRKAQQAIIGSTKTGSAHTIETILNGDIVICGVDMVFRKLVFNSDGSIGWIDVSSQYTDYI